MFTRTWIDESVTVHCDADQLHTLLSDVDAWPQWTRGLQAIKRRGREPFAVGTRFTMVLAPGVPLPCEMLVYQPGHLEWGGGVGASVVRHSFEITPVDAQHCTLRHREYATGFLAVLTMPLERGIYRYDHRWTQTILARFSPR